MKKIHFLVLFVVFPGFISAQSNTLKLAVKSPSIDVASVNTKTVALYEKFEISVSISDVDFSNPYDPSEVDLRCIFDSPSGKQWELFGFYDDYQDRNEWKVRFAPNETGNWTYTLKLIHSGGTIESTSNGFEAVQSDHDGWIRVSQKNPHYFEHDNGKSYYGIGPYYPWGVSNSNNGLGLMEDSGANLFGYWNIMYGGESGIIESIGSGLGRYNQNKCGRIDQLIQWAEERNMKMMLAIWPHDLLCETLGGWAKQWDSNPYQYITTSADFYGSQEAWEYQKKQYRYLIARWGYSRGLGIWEIVNEITGTEGWAAGNEADATNWVRIVSDYLKYNDPFGRPTTASKHGGYYWPEGYAQVDISNVHVYETGWNMEYQGNPLRSSHYIYHWLSNMFWNDFEQPGIFGEAGYTNTYGDFATPSSGYTAHYHNALWASWASGLAATPVWWDMGSSQVMSNDVMAQMKAFSRVAPIINYTDYSFSTFETTINDCDVYCMVNDSLTFGWVRDILGSKFKVRQFEIGGLPDTTYAIRWFDTWSGDELETTIGISIDSVLTVTSPDYFDNPDYAFLVTPLQGGGDPVALSLTSSTSTILKNGSSTAVITCMVKDTDGLISTGAGSEIHFSVKGSGELLDNDVVAENGYVRITYRSGMEGPFVRIVAESAGLQSDSITISLTDQILVDSFDDYADNTSFETTWQVQGGTNTQLNLVSSNDKLMKVTYAIGDGSPPYAGFQRALSDDYSDTGYLRFYLIPDGSDRDLAMILRSGNLYWRYDHKLSGSTGKLIEIPIADFVPQNTESEVDLANLTLVSFSILPGDGGNGSGEIYLDDFAFSIGMTTDVEEDYSGLHVPNEFRVYDNFPNPFNPSTTIRYELQYRSHLKLEVFDILGRLVTTLVDEVQSGGTYEVVFNTISSNRELSSGTYFIRFQAGSFHTVKKITLLK